MLSDRDSRPGDLAVITEENLGAWLIRANPRITDLRPFLGPRRRAITGWCLAENYRTRLVRPGQKVVFWVTGPRGAPLTRGVWGTGWTTGRADDAGDRGHRPSVPLSVTVLDEPLPATTLAEVPGLARLEVLRAPQMSNPSWVSRDELAALAPLLGPWPPAPAGIA